MTEPRNATPEEQFREVTRGAVDVHTRDDLLRKLRASHEKRIPLRVKMGFDPTRRICTSATPCRSSACGASRTSDTRSSS